MIAGFIYIQPTIIFFQIFVCANVIAHALPRRDHFWPRLLLCCLVAFSFTLFVPSPTSSILAVSILIRSLIYLLDCAFCYLTLMVCYKAHWSSYLFCAVTGYTLQHAIYLVFAVYYKILTTFVPAAEMPTIFARRYYHRLFFTPIMVLIGYWMGALIKKRKEVALPSAISISWSVVFFLSNVVISQFPRSSMVEGSFDYDYYLIDFYNFLCCALLLGFMFISAERYAMAKERAILARMQEERATHYAITRESIDLINMKYHDLKKELLRVREFDVEELQAMKIYDTDIKTGREALDAILQERMLICQKRQIRLECMIDADGLSAIGDADLYSLFGNILDNAMEAVGKLSNPDERIITLNIKSVPGFCMVKESNPIAAPIVWEGGFPKSPKDSAYHGFGVRSIAYISEKYGGALKMGATDKGFELTIAFPFPQNH